MVTRGLGSLEVASLKQYADHWANMVMMLARTINRESDEENAVKFWFFDQKRIMNSEQKQKLQKLLCEAKKDNPNENVLELLLFDLNMSIICNQNPLQTNIVGNISMKTPSNTYCKLRFLDHDGGYRFIRDMTKVHAIMVFCFRATILYAIFIKEGIITIQNEGRTHD